MSLPLFHTSHSHSHTEASSFPLYMSPSSTPGTNTSSLVFRHNADTLRHAATKQAANEHTANEEEDDRNEIVFRWRAEDLMSRVLQARHWHNLKVNTHVIKINSSLIPHIIAQEQELYLTPPKTFKYCTGLVFPFLRIKSNQKCNCACDMKLIITKSCFLWKKNFKIKYLPGRR